MIQRFGKAGNFCPLQQFSPVRDVNPEGLRAGQDIGHKCNHLVRPGVQGLEQELVRMAADDAMRGQRIGRKIPNVQGQDLVGAAVDGRGQNMASSAAIRTSSCSRPCTPGRTR